MIAQRFIRDQSGSSAIEFAMILPLLLIFLFGIIDDGPGVVWVPGKGPIPVDPGWRAMAKSIPAAKRISKSSRPDRRGIFCRC